MEVDGDTLEGFWNAITSTESFTVCYDELLQGGYTVPGWGSPQMGIIFILELKIAFTEAKALKFGTKLAQTSLPRPLLMAPIRRD